MTNCRQLSGAQSAFQTPLTIREVVDNIHKKNYFLPAIQREFVWNTGQIVTLLDSLMREFPIGSFLFWQVQKEKIKDFQFYDFVTNYHERDSTHNPKANVSGEQAITCILDGQQRLTALFLALRGTYAEKIPWKRWDSPDAFPAKKLHLNLLSKADDPDLLYDFRFLTPIEASEKNDTTFWFEAGKILDLQEESEVNDFLIENELSTKPKEAAKFANQTLFRLFSVIHKTRVINYYLEVSQELDKVLKIFIRVNSGGTPLSYSDLLLSIATAQWKTHDAREEITNFVDAINRIGDGFTFDKDFVLKSCLVLSDISNIAFKVDNFNAGNTKTIEEKWESMSKAIRLSVELVSSYGYNFQTLTSNNALIPIAYYIQKCGDPDGFVLSTHYADDRVLIRRWLTRSLIKRAFSGQPDTVLRPVRDIIKTKSSSFPFKAIVEEFRGQPKSIEFTEADLDNLLLSEYGDELTFSVLSLLYPTFDYRNKFHEDHIFPKKLFNKREMTRMGISPADQEKYIEGYNRISNLQLLEGLPNEEKSGKEFERWLNETCPSATAKKEFMSKHLIPSGIDLKFANFLEFNSQREKLIRSELKDALS